MMHGQKKHQLTSDVYPLILDTTCVFLHLYQMPQSRKTWRSTWL